MCSQRLCNTVFCYYIQVIAVCISLLRNIRDVTTQEQEQ